jgi:pantoate kinase
MRSMKGIAFAPGHISAFFEPVYNTQNMDRSGSRGAGMSISLGAISHVTLKPSIRHAITVHLNGKPSSAPVTKLALQYLTGETPFIITVETTLHLPVSQGCGMSAAGALSSALAVADILHLPREQAIKAAHYAEVQMRTGLGDVIASSFGGIEMRRRAGLPPWGMLEHIPGEYPMVVCIIGKKIETTTILSDPQSVDRIANYGRYCTKKLLEKPSLEHLFSLGLRFTQKIGIADKDVLRAINAANTHGMASMCMLGNSIFATGNTPQLCKILSPYGKVYCCAVDLQGARVLREK